MAATDDPRPAEPTIERFLDEPTRDLREWAWLWQGDHAFPLTRQTGLRGRLGRFAKRLLRPFVLFATRDLWDRQRSFNLILIETLGERLAQTRAELAALQTHVQTLQQQSQAALEEHLGAIEAHARLLEGLDVRTTEGFGDLLRHGDALFSRVDWKLDRYRREARELWDRLGALIAAGQLASLEPLARVQREQTYLELERRYRGSEAEIAERIAAYLPLLEPCGDVLDLGAGRGEAVELFARAGLVARGVDSNAEMVAHCRAKGLEVVEGDLFEHLAGLAADSLGAVVSFHVIEHLPPERVETLVRLAWRALRSGGVLILETPSPLALVMSARNFWIDPTHARPVHPASLEVAYREAGFEPVHRLDLHPFPPAEHLPEIDLAGLPETQHALADHVNRLRDLLDDLLYGCRDFGMVGHKP
ncbi:MAG: methyltransferase domain-containing protein [Thermoanaerobaculia bacterium]|nr:methyltransferase domain-containing protein [Thermoanaerobaculia bacterium]